MGHWPELHFLKHYLTGKDKDLTDLDIFLPILYAMAAEIRTELPENVELIPNKPSRDCGSIILST